MKSNNIFHIDTYINSITNIKCGTFIDITNDVHNSITYNFLKLLGWSGIVVSNDNIALRKHVIAGKVSYSSLLQLMGNKLIDLCVLDIIDNSLLQLIVTVSNRPKLVVVKYDWSCYLSICKLLNDGYLIISNIKLKYLICKRKVSILLITRCTRPNNLQMIKSSIQLTFRNSGINYHWYIIVLGKKVTKLLYLKYEKLLKGPNITYMYTMGTGHYLFSGLFLNMALNDHITAHCQYSYVLDDDNLIHYNFVSVIKLHLYSNRLAIVVNLLTSLYDIDQNIGVDCRGIVDNANTVIRRDVLLNIGGYQLTPQFVRVGWAEDALTFKKLVLVKTDIVYTHKIGGYHNGIDYVLNKNRF